MKTPWALGLLLAAVWTIAGSQEQNPAGTLPGTPPTPPENVGKPIGQPDAGFEQLDGNRDRRLSRTEAKASTELTARFAEFDANGDGVLSREEYAAFGREPPAGARPSPAAAPPPAPR